MEIIHHPQGVFLLLEGYPSGKVRPIRMAALTLPQFPVLRHQSDLPRRTSKMARNLSYGKSNTIRQGFLRLREEALVTQIDISRVTAFITSQLRLALSQLMDSGIEFLMQRITNSQILLLGVDIQPLEDLDEYNPNLTFLPSPLDAYPDVTKLEDIVLISPNGSPTLHSVRSHPQMIELDYKFMETIIHEYLASKLPDHSLPDILVPSDSPLISTQDGNYGLKEGSHVFVFGRDQSFGDLILLDTSSRQILLGYHGQCPPNFTPIPMSRFRVDLNDMLGSDEGRVLMQVFEYLFEEDGFSTAFATTHMQFIKSVHEYSSRYNSFSKLYAGLDEALRDGWMVGAVDAIQLTMNGLSALSHRQCFDVPTDDMLQDLPQYTYIDLDCDLPTAAFFFLCLLLRIDLEGIALDRIIIDHEFLSILLFREKMQTLLTSLDMPFHSYTTIHHVSIMRGIFEKYPILALDELAIRLLRPRFDKSEKPLFESPFMVYHGVKYPILPPSTDHEQLERYMTMLPPVTTDIADMEAPEVIRDDVPNTEVSDSLPQHDVPNILMGMDQLSLAEAISNNEETDAQISDTETTNLEITHTDDTEIVDSEVGTELHSELHSTQTSKRVLEHETMLEKEVVSVEMIPEETPMVETETDQPEITAEQPEIIEPENTLYEQVFDTHAQLDIIRNSSMVEDHDKLLTYIQQSITYRSILLHLRSQSMPYEDTLDTQELMKRGMIEVQVRPEGKVFAITQVGREKIGAELEDLKTLVQGMPSRQEIEKLLSEHTLIIETARNKGQLHYLLSLVNWSQLLAVGYYHRYSRYDVITTTFCKVFARLFEKQTFFPLKHLEEMLMQIIDQYLEHFHDIEQEIRKPYVIQEEVTKVPKPNEEVEESKKVLISKSQISNAMRVEYKRIKGSVAKERNNEQTLVMKRKAGMRKSRKLQNIRVPRSGGSFDISLIDTLSVQSLRLPTKMKIFLKVVDKNMTIAQFRDSDIDYSLLDLSARTVNPTLDIRAILRDKLLQDDLLYLFEDDTLQELFDQGLRCGHYPDEMRLQVPMKHFSKYMKYDTPKKILEPLLDYLLDGFEHESQSIDEELHALKVMQEKTGNLLLTGEVLDLSYGLKYQDVMNDHPEKLEEFRQRLGSHLDQIVLPAERLRRRNTDREVMMT